MKIKFNKIRLLPFGVLAVIFGVTGLLLPKSQTFANNPVKIVDFTASGNIEIPDRVEADPTIRRVGINFTIPNAKNYKGGDYLEVSTKNLDLAFSLDGKDVIANDGAVVGVVRKVSSTRIFNLVGENINIARDSQFNSLVGNDSGVQQVLRIEFNDKISEVDELSFKIVSENFRNSTAYTTRDYVMESKIFSDNKEIVAKSYTVVGQMRQEPQRITTSMGYFNVSSDGQKVKADGMNMYLVQTVADGRRKFRAGDIIEWKIDDSSKIVFGDNGRVGDILSRTGETFSGVDDPRFINPNGLVYKYIKKSTPVRFEVVESTPRVFKLKLLDDIETDAYYRVIPRTMGFNILEVSNETVDVEKQTTKPFVLTRNILDSLGNVVVSEQSSIWGAIKGVKLSADYVKSSIPVDYPKPNELPILPTPAVEIKPKTEEFKKVQAPNTGLASSQTFLLILFGVLASGTLFFIKKR